MNRRNFLQALAALLPGAAAARNVDWSRGVQAESWKSRLPVITDVQVSPKRLTAGELVAMGVPISSVGCHLIDSRSKTAFHFMNGKTNWNSFVYMEDVLWSELIATANATNVCLLDGWLKADDVFFPCVIGNEFILAVSLNFASGQNPIIGFPHFNGLPMTPNGGDVTLSWPPEGVVKLV